MLSRTPHVQRWFGFSRRQTSKGGYVRRSHEIMANTTFVCNRSILVRHSLAAAHAGGGGHRFSPALGVRGQRCILSWVHCLCKRPLTPPPPTFAVSAASGDDAGVQVQNVRHAHAAPDAWVRTPEREGTQVYGVASEAPAPKPRPVHDGWRERRLQLVQVSLPEFACQAGQGTLAACAVLTIGSGELAGPFHLVPVGLF